MFTLSACMAGVAGALYVPQVGIINPSEFSPGNSIEAVIWVAVGGRGTLTGAVLGAVLVNYGKTYFTSGFLAPYWLFVLGGLFVLVTLLLPRGIVGTDPSLVGAAARATRSAGGAPRPAASPTPAPQPGGVSAWTRRTTTALLYLDGVTVSFDGFRRSTICRFTIEPGEMRAIIGPNGAGKTTMMDVVTGKTRPDNGDVYFDGTLRSDRARRDRDRRCSASAASSRSRPCSRCTPSRTICCWRSRATARARATLFWRATADRGEPHRRHPRHHPAAAMRAARSPARCRTARSNGSRSACCWRRSRSCCWSTSRSPA